MSEPTPSSRPRRSIRAGRLLGGGALEPALPRAARPHAHSKACGGGVHAAERGSDACAGLAARARAARPAGRARELRCDLRFAQPYSIALICALLGVPVDRHRDLLDWSHALVKMYEFDTTEEQADSATAAAAEFRDYVLELIAERRRSPRDDLVSRARRGASRWRPPVGCRDRVDRHRAPERRARGDRQHARERRARAHARARPSGTGRRRARSRAARGDRGAAPLRPSSAAVRALGARGRCRDRRRPARRGEKVAVAVRRREPRSTCLRRRRRRSTSPARMPPSTSRSAEASTSASGHRSRASSSKRASERSWTAALPWSSSRAAAHSRLRDLGPRAAGCEHRVIASTMPRSCSTSDPASARLAFGRTSTSPSSRSGRRSARSTSARSRTSGSTSCRHPRTCAASSARTPSRWGSTDSRSSTSTTRDSR